MPQTKWYYAKNDKENGPVTQVQLAALIKSGKVRETDLVWREGMNDWAPLNETSEFLRQEMPVVRPPAEPPADSHSHETADEELPVGDVANAASAERNRVFRTTHEPPPPPEEPPASGQALASAQAPAAPAPASPPMRKSSRPLAVREVGQALAVSGLLLALLGKGCDLTAERYVQRQRALASMEAAQSEGNDTDSSTNSPAALEELNEAAKTAEWSQAAGAYWHGVAFVFGSILLTLGLSALSVVGNRQQRWMCLAMLSIIVYALFVGGGAWHIQPMGNR